MKKIYLFKRYERLWHWVQSILIVTLLVTGFTLHGTLSVVPFFKALSWHEWAGLILVILTAFTMFWHATSGEGKQFIPTHRGLADQIRFYTSGIFRHAPHPTLATPESKFNPIQKMAYFSLLVFIFPVQMITGLLLWGLPRWPWIERVTGGVFPLALIHTAGAFAMLLFLIVHLYMITTGHKLTSNLRGMLTGWVDEDSSDI